MNGTSAEYHPVSTLIANIALGDLQSSITGVADKVKALDASQKTIKKDITCLSNLVKAAVADLKTSSAPTADFIDRLTALEAQVLEHGSFLQHVKNHLEHSIRDQLAVQVGRLERLEVMAVAAKEAIAEFKLEADTSATVPSKRPRIELGIPALPNPAPTPPPVPSFFPTPTPFTFTAPQPGTASSGSGFTDRNPGQSGITQAQVPTGDVAVGQFEWGPNIPRIFENLYTCLPPDVSRSLPRPTAVRRVGKAVIRARFGSPEQAAQFVYAWNVGPITPPEEKVKGLAYVRASHIEKYDQAFFSNPADGSLKF
ncbi:hypothetical protein EST38_g8488 [Candolleomyces aberdarensis]|uniref:Uncharacterized protein n=1 Tax=Candolleomyces aberdarensis TaxID=2316362 RepID=A0A4V1Q351_9AGAR|nr:hypothetical protein EST38_g8488 [Candolleomyces aberdarensis]